MDLDELVVALGYHEKGNLSEATLLYKESADKLHPMGMYMYSIATREGFGCKPEPKRAFELLVKTIDIIIFILEHDINNLNELKSKYGKLPEKALVDAPIDVSKIDSHRVSLRASNSIKKLGVVGTGIDLVQLCKQMAALPLVEIGLCYFHGWGCKKNVYFAHHYFKIAASLGDETAIEQLAYQYENGIGVKKSKLKAAKLMRVIKQDKNHWVWKSKYNIKSDFVVDTDSELVLKLKQMPDASIVQRKCCCW